MPETPELSEARRALLEKYLRGEIQPEPTRQESRPAQETAAPAPDTSAGEGLLVPVVPIRSTGSKRPFFYSHVHVDGGAFYCFTLADRLGPEQPFYILEPHRFDAGQIPRSLESMAGEYIRSMRTVQPHGPYLLGGFCGGGLIVFEMAHQLRQQGEEVDLLLLVEPVDGPGPASYRMVLRNLAGSFVRSVARLLRLTWQQQLDWFLRMRHYYVLVRHPYYRKRAEKWLRPGIEMLHKDWIGIFVWLISAYKPVKYQGTVTYLWAKEEFISKREWGEKQAEALEREVQFIPGNHWSCRTDYLADYASCLSECVSIAQTARCE
jgi:Thioesterase domain